MPSIHIPDKAFRTLADELGYQEAKRRVKKLAREEASRVSENGENE